MPTRDSNRKKLPIQATPKQLLLRSVPGFFLSMAILAVFYLIKPGFPLMLIGVNAWILIASLWQAYRAGWNAPHWGVRMLKLCAGTTAFILLLRILNIVLGPYGFIGLVTISCVTAAWLIWRRWDVYIWGVRESYKIIFGRYPR